MKATYIFVLFLVASASAHAQSVHFSGASATLFIGTLTHPYGMAVDASGNVYVADTATNSISELTPSGILQSGLLSGDGAPYGIAVDAARNLYVTDESQNEVVKETLQGDGSYSKSVLPLSGLSNPTGIAVDSQGNVYVADSANNRVVRATPAGGTYTQSTVTTSALSFPEGVAFDAGGNLFIADSHHFRVIKETPSGNNWSESTVANLELYGAPPIGIAVDGAGHVFILNYQDDEHFSVVKATLSGGAYALGIVPSHGQNPYAIAADAAGDAYLVSPGSHRLLEEFGPTINFGAVKVGYTTSTISFSFVFTADTPMPQAAALTQGNYGGDFMYTGTGNCATEVPPFTFHAGDTCSMDVAFTPFFPGSRNGAAALLDFNSGVPLATVYISGTGIGPQVTFPPGKQVAVAGGLRKPSGLAVDGGGSVYVAENNTGNIEREFLFNGGYSQTTIASGLDHPTGLALDGAGNLYVATANGVYKETRSYSSYSQSQVVTDLTNLNGIAVDAYGNLYLTSSALGNVHKETLQADGSYVESAIGYGIPRPQGVAVDGLGDIFIVNAAGNHMYEEVLQPNGGYLQISVPLSLAEPVSIVSDGRGNLAIADPSHGEISVVTPVANGSYAESGVLSGLIEPSALAVGVFEDLHYAEGTASGRILRIDITDPPALSFPKTIVGTSSPEQYVNVWNVGTAPLTFPVPTSGTNASLPAGFVFAGDTTCPVVGVAGTAEDVEADSSCVYGISLAPKTRGSFTGNLVLTDTNLNEGPGNPQQTIALSGSSTTSDTTRTTMRVSPNPVKAGLGVTVTVTVTDMSNPAAIPQGGVTFTDSLGGALIGGAPVTLSGGKAVLTMTATGAGTHTITAHYAGVDDSFLGSTGQVSLTVQ